MKKFSAFPRSFALSFLIVSQSFAAVWETENQWSPQWEKAYQSWVKAKWDTNFFIMGPKTYRGLALDCADAVYSMRAIFAAENKLPFAVRDPSGGGKLITNEMSRFDNLDAESRKRAFLEFLFTMTSTRTLPNDSYPTALSREALGSGSFALTDASNHHSWTIREITLQGIPNLIFASRPARAEMFYRKYIPSTSFMFPNGNTLKSNAGFRNFRRQEDLLKPVFQVAGFSDEQYKIPLNRFHREFQTRMASRGENPAERLTRIMEDSCAGAKERVVFVRDGLKYLSRIQGRCMNAQEFDDHSTPGRDARLKDNFLEIAAAFAQVGNSWGIDRALYNAARAISEGATENSYCSVEVSKNLTLSLSTIVARSLRGDLSSNPNDGLEYRWGEIPGGLGPRGQACPRY